MQTKPIPLYSNVRIGIGTCLKTIRLHQWLKNLLVFVPILAAHNWQNREALTAATAMFFAFGFIASGAYVINDLIDLPSDRSHPSKRQRPIAAGQIQVSTAIVIAIGFILVGLVSAAAISGRAVLVLGVYLVSSVVYSLSLKRFVIVDALTLAGLYTLRIIGGATVVGVTPSVWLLAFSGFIFLSLGLVKRCSELDRMARLNQMTTPGRGYRVSDDLMLKMMGVTSGYMATLVAALYINSAPAKEQYRTPEALWFICPFLLYWVSRMWIKTARGEMHDDPLVYSGKDPVSWTVFAAIVMAWAAAHVAF